jgi:hypothetical protein
MGIRILTGVLALLLLASLGSIAAPSENPKITLDATDMSIQKALAEIGSQAGVQIMCDSDVKGAVTGSFQSTELEKALNSISNLNKLKWKKVYLSVQADQKPTLAQVKARAEAVTAISGGPVVVYDPATGKQRVFVEQDPATPSIDPVKLGLKPVYLVTNSTSAIKDAQSDKQDTAPNRLESLQQERMKLLAEMNPQQRVAAYQQEMLMMAQADPATRQQMVLDQMNARRNMDPQSQEMYRNAMRDTRNALRAQGLIPDRGPRGGGGRGPGN